MIILIISSYTAAGHVTILAVHTHLSYIKNAISEAREKWRDIGRALGLSEGTIQSIHRQTIYNSNESLHQVLSLWMYTGKATTQHLLEALEDPAVRRTDIANHMRDLRGEDRTNVGLEENKYSFLTYMLLSMIGYTKVRKTYY